MDNDGLFQAKAQEKSQYQDSVDSRPPPLMEPAHIIRDAIAEVQRLRNEAKSQQSLSEATSAVKRFQAQRFATTYQDLISAGPYQAATKFFLSELYGEDNYSTRDTQFARIAGAIQRLLPQSAVTTAVCLAQLHVLTERLDLAMGQAWVQDGKSADTNVISVRYARAWRRTGDEEARQQQLKLLLEIGRDLDTLTRTPGLRLLLKMMRGPAQAAGMADLQRFLEQGFDTFATMGKKQGATEAFLQLIEQRETMMLQILFSGPPEYAAEYLGSMDKTDHSISRAH